MTRPTYLPKGWPVPIPGDPVVQIKRPMAHVSDASRGSVTTLSPPAEVLSLPDPKKRKEVVRLVQGCVEGELLCVTCGITVVSSGPSLGVSPFTEGVYAMPMIRGSIIFGEGDAAQFAEFDWLHGTQLSVGTDTAEVSAQYLRYTLPWDPVAPEDIPVPPTFKLACGFAYGNVGRNSNPARLTEVVQIEDTSGVGATVRVPVPPFAVSVIFLPTATAMVDMNPIARLTMVAYGTGYGVPINIVQIPSNAGQYNVENAFPIPNGVQAIEVTNTSASILVGFLVFGLSL